MIPLLLCMYPPPFLFSPPHISARKKVTHARKKKIPLLSLPAVVLMPLKKALSAGGGGPRANSAGSDFVPRVPVFGEDDPAGEICLSSHAEDENYDS